MIEICIECLICYSRTPWNGSMLTGCNIYTEMFQQMFYICEFASLYLTIKIFRTKSQFLENKRVGTVRQTQITRKDYKGKWCMPRQGKMRDLNSEFWWEKISKIVRYKLSFAKIQILAILSFSDIKGKKSQNKKSQLPCLFIYYCPMVRIGFHI